MAVHIGIPELEERGLTNEEFYRVILIKLRYKVKHLQALYPSKSINDLEAYPLQIAMRIIKIADTLHSIIERDQDYVSTNIIVRSLADSISSLILIYKEKDEDTRILRHYLYIMDGLYGRIKLLPDNFPYDGKLRKDEYNALAKQVADAKVNYKAAYECSVSQIRELVIYKGHKFVIDKLTQNRNWKFKSLGSQQNSYKWKEMYDLFGLKCPSEYFSSLSEFVHGLSTSNLSIELDELTFDALYCVAISLLGKLDETISDIYKDDMNDIQRKVYADSIMDTDYPIL